MDAKLPDVAAAVYQEEHFCDKLQDNLSVEGLKRDRLWPNIEGDWPSAQRSVVCQVEGKPGGYRSHPTE
jgi:hypothetical protein